MKEKDMKKKSRKIRFINVIAIILLPLLLTGCFNYNDINKVTFTTGIIFDVDDLGRTVVYLDCIKPFRSTNEGSDKGRRILYKGEGKTALEALDRIGKISSNKLNYTQTRAYIFTEKAAQKGIKKFLDLINNYSEMQVKPSAYVYYGDIAELLKATANDEEYLGMLLTQLVSKSKFGPEEIESNINYYLSNTLMGDNTLMLPAIKLTNDVLDQKIQLDGSAIMKENVLVGKLEAEDSLMYSLLMGKNKQGILTIGNPNTEDGYISLNILASTANDQITVEGDKINIFKDIDIEVSIAEIQGSSIVDNNLLEYIKNTEEAYINMYMNYIFNKYKEKDLDIFDTSRIVEIKYPKMDKSDILSRTTLTTNTKITINGTGVAKYSL